MNKKTISLLLMILSSGLLYAQVGRIVFLEGSVDHRTGGGKISRAALGQNILNGESLITAKDGYCEVEMDNGSLISLNSDTVFAFNEIEDKEEKGKKRNIFSCIFGSADFKFKKFTGKEPYIATPSTVCGVRGTDFSVLAGADGSALYVVASGEVLVEAAGQAVALLPDEGVKVNMGQAPGKKFEVKDGYIDFSEIEAETEAAMMADPVGTFDKIAFRMDELIKETDYWYINAKKLYDFVKIEREKALAIKTEKGEEAYKTYYYENIRPAEADNAMMMINMRFTAYSAFSLRRYLASYVYITMRTKYILNTDDKDYQSFMKKYESFLRNYSDRLIKTEYLYEGDI